MEHIHIGAVRSALFVGTPVSQKIRCPRNGVNSTSRMMQTSWLENVRLMFWPSSILMLGDPEDKSVMLPILSVTLNAALYAILGWLLWIGVKRSRIVLIATAASILVGWYGLLRL